MREHMSRVLADRIDNDTWENHRDIIVQLFIHENRKLKDVMDIMSKNHGFKASKSQYEARFQSWDVRKKIKAQEWDIVILHVQKRAQDGEETQVTFRGMLLEQERVTREKNRRKSRLNRRINNTQNLPPIPRGFELQSPPSAAATHTDVARPDPSPAHALFHNTTELDTHADLDFGLPETNERPFAYLPAHPEPYWNDETAPEEVLWTYLSKVSKITITSVDSDEVLYEASTNALFWSERQDLQDHLRNQIKHAIDEISRFHSGEYAGTVSAKQPLEISLEIAEHKWQCAHCRATCAKSPVFNYCIDCGSSNGMHLVHKFKEEERFEPIVHLALWDILEAITDQSTYL